ncbi:sigma-54 interaction domain-containing protein [Fonticella tunisiensis]|uniref:HTH-type transcriptional regulatory protein TyrR n=1 Tax=Fonticella tunisiensis TaxID=1096341 RepID=A0A4R7KQM2_9CLOT|nr:sigma 54-interacting transcriptional regulator [Fonticella tunisiensis]TDT61365.1 transcriptional regulator with PAS, ATPase and Fis domain [Fonticella tunisiensis]
MSVSARAYEYISRPIMVLDKKLNIKYFNRAFSAAFKVSSRIEEGKNVDYYREYDCLGWIHKRKKEIEDKSIESICIDGNRVHLFYEENGDVYVVWDISAYNSDNKVKSMNEPVIIGKNKKFMEVLNMAKKIASTEVPVVICGESGTGKELLADLIHSGSWRKDGPFVKVNCAAFPQGLLESELFGYEKGAFTGALKDKRGIFEIADGGTLFLDEIGELPLEMQAKLLRALQNGEIQRLGSERKIIIDVRVIAATNRNLEEMVMKGKFRLDLFYRLNVVNLLIPPLRERRDDIEMMVEYFIEKINIKNRTKIKGISKEALDVMMNYNWPGNIRELMNVVERMIVLAEGEYLYVNDLPKNIRNCQGDCVKECAIESFLKDGKISKIEDYEKEIIRAALEKYGSFNAAAKALGVTHATVASKAKKYQIVGY